jgi:uncharacterized BrkB/YihY/UPF0761 family membrane protein
VPRPDTTPPAPDAIKRRFWRIFRLLALLSVAIAGLAVVLVAQGQSQLRIHMLMATALGTGLMVLVGSALMTLVFLSASSGHDDSASDSHRKDHE